jgi:hypothetical protein
MMLEGHHLEVFADYFQFILQDEYATWDEELIATSIPKLLSDLFAVTPGMIHVGTVRNMTVPVTIEIHDFEPYVDPSCWQQINECSLDIPSGQMVVMGNDYFPMAPRIPVTPGMYRAKILYTGLDTLNENGLDGDDSYTIQFWLGTSVEPRILKSRTFELLRGSSG